MGYLVVKLRLMDFETASRVTPKWVAIRDSGHRRRRMIMTILSSISLGRPA